MMMKYRPSKSRSFQPLPRAQAMVEFAIALPILLLLLVGILEAGRLVFIYSAVTNASREASRYGSAVGLNDSGTSPKYQDCEGIRNMARRSAYFMNLADADIIISYDHGPGTGSPFDECPVGMTADPSIQVNTLDEPDRVVVTVTSTYSPMVNLVPITSRTITSTSARTILGILDMTTGKSVVPTTTPTKTAGAADPPTDIPSETPTLKPTDPSDTPTATEPGGDFITFTPLPSSTPTLTPTETLTPTLTFTPTNTSTPVPGCSNITAGAITVGGLYGPKSMSMTITNPHDAITVSDVQVTWNSSTGGPGSSALILTGATLNTTTFWIGASPTGSGLTITPSTTVTIPGNNITSTIIFTFDRNYQNPSGNSITINLSTIGCESYPIQRP
jgi:Flp pilus assembly protein TadG